jgi:hypothetical protein
MIARLDRVAPAVLTVVLAWACGHGSTAGPSAPSANVGPSPSPTAATNTLVRTSAYGAVPASFAPTVMLVSSTPGDGGRVTFAYGDPFAHDLTLSFAVTAGVESYLSLYVEMLSASGRSCAAASNQAPDNFVHAGRPATFTLTSFQRQDDGADCAYSAAGSFTTSRLRVQLNFQNPDSPFWGWTGEMQLPRAFTWYGTALSAVETAPTITALGACVKLNQYEGPGPRWDEMSVICDAHEPDGEALTFDIRFESEAGCGTDWQCWSQSETVGRRNVDQPIRSEGTAMERAPAPPVRGTATCTVTDTHGRIAQRSVCVSVRGKACPEDTCVSAAR